jgi:hypothetical protein
MTTTEAPQTPQMAPPQREHAWLQKLVGEWTCESTADMGPEQGKVTTKGVESVRSLGGFWVLAEGQMEMPCGAGEGTMVMTLGYDGERRQYVGTWVGSMMGHMWHYAGGLDADERVLTLNAEGPDMMNPGQTAQYQDIVEFVNDDHRLLRSRVRGGDGNWIEFMVAHFHRKK